MDPGSRSGPVPYPCPHRCATWILGWTPSVRPWNRSVKSCFIISYQLLTSSTSGPWLQKWACSKSVPSTMWNPNTGAHIKCPAMEPMSQIMFYNQLPTSDTIHKWTLVSSCGPVPHLCPHRCGTRILLPTPSVRPWNRCVKSCFIISCQLMTPFTSGPWLYQVSGHGTDVSNHRTLLPTPSVWPWNRCVKSCFIINCQLLTPFTSGPWLQKWAGSTSVPSPMWNPDTGADSKCPATEPKCQIMFYNQLPTSDTIHKWILAPEMGSSTSVPSPMWSLDTGADTKFPDMELMCQIMFYNELPTTDTIHKWTLAPEVGRFHISAFTDVEPRHWGRHQVSRYETDVSNHVL